MIGIFRKKEQKFYRIETDSVSGDAVFNMFSKMLSTSHATYVTDHVKSTIAFVSTKTDKEILAKLENTFGDTYNIEDKGVFISMTPKMVEAL